MQSLTLRIDGDGAGDAQPADRIRTEGKEPLRVGRRSGNDWVLPDTTRHISGLHFEITRDGDAFVLHDRSTNGTFLNAEKERVVSPYKLVSGDTIRVGLYRIAVRLDDLPRAASTQAPPTGRTGVQAPPGQRATLAPVFSPPEAPARPSGTQIPDFAKLGTTGTGVALPPMARQTQAPEPIPEAPALDPLPEDALEPAAIPEPDLDDLIPDAPGTEDILAGPPEAAPLPAAKPEATPLAVEPEPVAPALAPKQAPESVAPTPDPAPPEVAPSVLIPEDDDLDLFGGPPAEDPPISVPAASPLDGPFGAPEAPPPAPQADAGPFGAPETEAATPFAAPADNPFDPQPAAPPPTPVADPVPAADAADLSVDFDLESQAPRGLGEAFGDPTPAPQPRPEPAPSEAVTPAPAPAPHAAPSASPPAPQTVRDDAFLRGFLAGAGLDPDTDPALAPEDLGRLVGLCLKQSTASLRDMLGDRKEIKKAVLDSERTVLTPTNTNPLKFSTDPEQAFAALFVTPKDGYMTGADGFDDAMRDLHAHYTAVVAAIQPAVADVLAGLSPEEIEAGAGKGRLGGGARKAWEAYQDKWSARTGDGDMLEVFAKAFARRYAEALDLIV